MHPLAIASGAFRLRFVAPFVNVVCDTIAEMAGRPNAKQPDSASQPTEDELFITACDLMATGLSVAAACAECGAIERRFFRWLANSPTAQQHYARARGIRSDARFERSDKVLLDMRAGVIDAAQARVELDLIKWQCGKESPKKYGERVELAGDPNAPLIPHVVVEFVSTKKVE